MKRWNMLLTVALLLTVMTSSRAMAEAFLFTFGSAGSSARQFQSPAGVAVDGLGNIYVADTDNGRVQKFGPSGNFILAFAEVVPGGNPPFPTGIAVDSTGNIYVSDPENRFVQKYTSSGSFLAQIEPVCTGVPGGCIDPDGPGGPRPTVYRPEGVAVDALDNVYVTGTFHLQKFGPAGNLLIDFPLGGIVPRAIAVDNSGNIIIYEKDNGTINKYDPAGNLLLQFGDTGCQLADGFGCVDPDGGGPLALGDGQFGIGGPGGIAVDASNNIYVTDARNARVQKFDGSGNFLLKFGTPGLADGQFGDSLSGIAVDPFGKISVVDTANNRIQVFGPDDIGAEFRDVRRAADINVGSDVCGTGHQAINFTGSVGSAGDTWITVHDPAPNPPPVDFGSVSLHADVLIKPFSNSKGAGLLALFNEAPGKKGLALIVLDAGNSDTLVLATVDQAGRRTTVKAVGLGAAIRECVWYRVTMDVAVSGGAVAVTGQVFQHVTPGDPDSAAGAQVGATLSFSGPRPAGVEATGEVGIVAAATSAVVNSSVTNFVIAP